MSVSKEAKQALITFESLYNVASKAKPADLELMVLRLRHLNARLEFPLAHSPATSSKEAATDVESALNDIVEAAEAIVAVSDSEMIFSTLGRSAPPCFVLV